MRTSNTQWWVLGLCAIVSAIVSACGARGGLRDPDATVDVLRVDAELLDVSVARDVLIPRACQEIELEVPPRDITEETDGDFVTPKIAARMGGFDLVAPAQGETAVKGRRFHIDAAARDVRFDSAVTVLGPNSFTWAEPAVFGNTLAIGYNADSGPRVRLYSGAYQLEFDAITARARGTMYGLARYRDGFVSMYQTPTGSPPAMDLVLLDRNGVTRDTPVPGAEITRIAGGVGSITSYTRGVAWVVAAAPTVHLVSLTDAGEVHQGTITTRTGTHRPVITRWPFQTNGLAAVEPLADNSLQVIVADDQFGLGLTGVILPTPGEALTVVGVGVAAMEGGLVVAAAHCSLNAESGVLRVHLVREDLTFAERPIEIPVQCTGRLVRVDAVSDGARAVVAYSEPASRSLSARKKLRALSVQCR
jgi:hypothetical protein